ncbi:MAG: peptidase S9 [Phycisphaerae bacterium SM23_33]|nr:MAG: peptidase S9 [Phycisphaerae bacterium SM23_33]
MKKKDAHAEPASAGLPPLIPREVLFGNPERMSPAVSPDGKYLAYLAPDEKDVLQVWLRTLGQTDDRPITADEKRGIRSYFWAYDGAHLVYLQDSDGDENYHLYGVNVQSGSVRDLTPFAGAQANLVAREPNLPGQLLVGINVRDRRFHDVHRVDLRSGAVHPDTENPGHVMVWEADAGLHVRAALAVTPDGGRDIIVRDGPGQEWRPLRHWPPDDDVWPLGFSADGGTLYVVASHDANAARLLGVDLAGGGETVLAEDPEYDVTHRVVIHPVKRHVEAAGIYRERLYWQVLHESVRGDYEALARVRRGDFRVASRDLADKIWLVSYVTDDGPVYYYTFDRAAKKAELLFTSQPRLEDLALARMEPVSFQARDGLTVHGYLTTPVGLPAKSLPAVLLVHGGPWARDTWDFYPTVQWLANRGYAVLQVNYRGSAGYGKAFLNAGNRQWAAAMHDDLIDGVNWLIARGVADRRRVAIMGGSYGGYATLVGLTFTPEVFAAGVDLVGPSSLTTLLRNVPPYWEPIRPLLAYRVGDVATEEEFLKSRSPLLFADRIQRPLLIGQGANDPRVKQAESDQIVQTMRQAGKPVEYVVYADEGHGFARPPNRLHFFAKAEAFLARYLGGRFEPMADIPGHSAEVR